MSAPQRVLSASSDSEITGRIAGALSALGYLSDRAHSARQCLTSLDSQDYRALLIHGEMEDLDVAALMEQARRRQPALAVVVVSDGGEPREIVRLVKTGLDDYWPAPLAAEEIAARLAELLGQRSRPAAPADSPAPALIGSSRLMHRVVEVIAMIAPKRSTVLITGPSGTGKELAARAIHELSPRAAATMVVVNCGAIPEHLLEAEFFGHVKGAFTGAVGARAGCFEQADGSTIFLDEIGDMPLGLQAKVLRVVQEREFQRLGSAETIRVDVRVIAATNCDLAEMVRRGEFREDLYYRLNVVPIAMPPLAERLEDLPLLVEAFLERICGRESIPPPRVSPATLERLMQYQWPGNVRQLENALEKAVLLSGGRQELYPSDFTLPEAAPAAAASLEPLIRLPAAGLDFPALIDRIERSLLEQALERAAGNKKRAADILRLKRTTLSAKLRRSRG